MAWAPTEVAGTQDAPSHRGSHTSCIWDDMFCILDTVFGISNNLSCTWDDLLRIWDDVFGSNFFMLVISIVVILMLNAINRSDLLSSTITVHQIKIGLGVQRKVQKRQKLKRISFD